VSRSTHPCPVCLQPCCEDTHEKCVPILESMLRDLRESDCVPLTGRLANCLKDYPLTRLGFKPIVSDRIYGNVYHAYIEVTTYAPRWIACLADIDSRYQRRKWLRLAAKGDPAAEAFGRILMLQPIIYYSLTSTPKLGPIT